MMRPHAGDSGPLSLTAVATETLPGYPSCFPLSWAVDRWWQLWALDVSLQRTKPRCVSPSMMSPEKCHCEGSFPIDAF